MYKWWSILLLLIVVNSNKIFFCSFDNKSI